MVNSRTYTGETNKAVKVRHMFDRISARYDLMNRLITFGLDRSWRRLVVTLAMVPKGGHLLDVGSGTGDIAFEARRCDPSMHIIAADISSKMMAFGRKRSAGRKLGWCQADALALPFPDGIFDAVTSGYLLRNVSNVSQALREQMRVVKPGRRVVCLDTSPPPRHWSRPFVLFYLKLMIPALGTLVAGDRAAYEYLHTSTRAFMEPDRLAAVMREIGFGEVSCRTFMFGTMAVCWGNRRG
jgi:demethylmenaquinone methyltransferase/2-methoxy-6-polyprenyl-1,4-benzoquinol methylase